MIAFLRGILIARDAQAAVIDVNGVGYRVGMSTQSLGSLGAIGNEVSIQTFLQVKDDGIALFGFTTEDERFLFEKLITVSGVGPKVALSALSTFSPASLLEIITAEDVARVSSIAGIGKKTAQRIILELRGVLKSDGLASAATADGGGTGTAEAVEALLGMGFTSAEISLALKSYEGDKSDVSALVRFGLKRLGTA
ncbi:MAG: Holliday junction branch migration protein RuvA [Coriobacteriales bacterium]|jgi:Holliday junction DNA helicase RuvA|nr:Holliday junction branch migration protein RuvA [Coriobacteriales bacterium]